MYNFIKNWVSTGDFLLFQSLIGNVQLEQRRCKTEFVGKWFQSLIGNVQQAYGMHCLVQRHFCFNPS